MTAFDDDFDAADEMLAEAFGKSVVLQRGLNQSDAFTANWCAMAYEVENRNGIRTRVHVREYEFPAEDAVINGETVEPRERDRLVDEDGTWEVMPPSDNLRAVESLAGGSRWLVRTTKIDD